MDTQFGLGSGGAVPTDIAPQGVPALLTIDWAPGLVVGIPQVDEDHQALVLLFNDLVHACQRGTSHLMRRHCIDTIIRFFGDHQSREEQHIHLRGCPGADAHIQEHAAANRFLDRLRHEADDADALVWTVLALRRWMIHHIVEHDIPMFMPAATAA